MSNERGSLLLMAIVALALLSLIVGTAAPVLGTSLRQDLTEETVAEMTAIGNGVVAYFEDHESFPSALIELRTPASGDDRWMGPYADDAFQNDVGTNGDVTHDPWRRPYIYEFPDAYSALIRSRGPNGIDEAGAGDDVERLFAVHHVLWAITMRELRILRPAIEAYNTHEAPPNLPNPWVAVVNRLQSRNILPKGPEVKFRFREDGWGNPYVPLGSPIDNAESAGPP